MMYHAKELKLNIQNRTFDYITFGKGTKPLLTVLQKPKDAKEIR